jgi:hypothetical protein
MELTELPLMAQSTYAELLELANLHAFETAFAEQGTFSTKTAKDRVYWYFLPARTPQNPAPTQRYVGPETEELRARIAQHRAAKATEKAQRALVRSLTHSYNVPGPLPAVARVVEGLARSGVFRLRGVLVGTVAYQTYAAMLGVRLRGALMQTSDVDVAQFLSVSIAVQDHTESMDSVLQGIDPSFTRIPNLGRSASTRYVSNQKLRVDFLVPNQGADDDEPLYLPALNTAAEPLRFLDFLIYEPVKAVLLHGAGTAITVPSPERFAIHKIIVSQRRKAEEAKAKKDLQQSATLIQILAQSRPEELKSAWEEAIARGPTWRELLTAGAAQLPASAKDSLAVAGIVDAAKPSSHSMAV